MVTVAQAFEIIAASELYLGSRHVQAAIVDDRLILAPSKGSLDSWLVTDYPYANKVLNLGFIDGIQNYRIQGKFDIEIHTNSVPFGIPFEKVDYYASKA